MSDRKRKPKKKTASHRDRGYTNILRHSVKHFAELMRGLVTISKQVASVEVKVNKLLEVAGEDEELRQLTETLRGPTESLESALEAANQSTQKQKDKKNEPDN